MIPSVLRVQSPLFVFAHPDDEVYCCGLMHRLIADGKRVTAVYLTSGDAGGDAERRELELRASMRAIGLVEDHFILLRIPELEIGNRLIEIIDRLCQIAHDANIDAIIGHEFEGGHEGHDFASFCASEVVRRMAVKTHIVFPVYHGKPGERLAAQFGSERAPIVELPFTEAESALKETVLTCHASQRESFERVGASTPSYMHLLMSREVFIVVDRPIDFSQRPMGVVGYEFHRNGFMFEQFQSALRTYLETVPN